MHTVGVHTVFASAARTQYPRASPLFSFSSPLWCGTAEPARAFCGRFLLLLALVLTLSCFAPCPHERTAGGRCDPPPPGCPLRSRAPFAEPTRFTPGQFLFFYPDSEAKLIEMINSQAVVA